MSAETAAIPAPARRPFWFRRRAVPLPTWRTWFVVLTALGFLAWWFVSSVHGWLAVVDPVERAPYMIVEGWAPDYVLEEAMDYAKDAPPRRIFTTGVPMDSGSFLSDYHNYAQLCAATLAKMGVSPQLLCPVPAAKADLERTRAMALALKELLDKENIPEADRRINLFTLGAHGRRSWRIFQQALGSTWKVGVISVPSEDYDPKKWYRQSAGAKTVLSELVALIVQ